MSDDAKRRLAAARKEKAEAQKAAGYKRGKHDVADRLRLQSAKAEFKAAQAAEQGKQNPELERLAKSVREEYEAELRGDTVKPKNRTSSGRARNSNRSKAKNRDGTGNRGRSGSREKDNEESSDNQKKAGESAREKERERAEYWESASRHFQDEFEKIHFQSLDNAESHAFKQTYELYNNFEEEYFQYFSDELFRLKVKNRDRNNDSEYIRNHCFYRGIMDHRFDNGVDEVEVLKNAERIARNRAIDCAFRRKDEYVSVFANQFPRRYLEERVRLLSQRPIDSKEHEIEKQAEEFARKKADTLHKKYFVEFDRHFSEIYAQQFVEMSTGKSFAHHNHNFYSWQSSLNKYIDNRNNSSYRMLWFHSKCREWAEINFSWGERINKLENSVNETWNAYRTAEDYQIAKDHMRKIKYIDIEFHNVKGDASKIKREQIEEWKRGSFGGSERGFFGSTSSFGKEIKGIGGTWEDVEKYVKKCEEKIREVYKNNGE